jgi:hypothetical protein
LQKVQENKYKIGLSPTQLQTIMNIREIVVEALPAKNVRQLYNIKRQLFAQPSVSTDSAVADPVVTPVAPTSTAQAETDLQTLMRRRAKLEQIIRSLDEIESLRNRASRTRYGITPGLAADIENIYPMPQTEQDMDQMLQGYDRIKQKLQQYIARQRRVFAR